MKRGIRFKVWDTGAPVGNPGRFWSHMVGGNGEIMNVGEGHRRKADAFRAVGRVWSGFYIAAGLADTPTAPVPYTRDSLKP